MRETTALGAAIAAGLAIGIWKDLDDVRSSIINETTSFRSAIDESTRFQKYELWQRAVERASKWVQYDNGTD